MWKEEGRKGGEKGKKCERVVAERLAKWKGGSSGGREVSAGSEGH